MSDDQKTGTVNTLTAEQKRAANAQLVTQLKTQEPESRFVLKGGQIEMSNPKGFGIL